MTDTRLPWTLRRCRSGLFVGVLAGVLLATPASAHVPYVSPGGSGPGPFELLARVLTDPLSVGLLLGGGVTVGLAGAAWLVVRPLRQDLAILRSTLLGYRDLLPWLVRLAVGLPLVGAGFNGYLFSPAVAPGGPEPSTLVRLFGLTVGFLLVFGLATRAAALVGLVGYLATLVVDPTVLLALEYVPGLVALLLLGGGRPSADHVLAALAADDDTVYSRFDPIHRLFAPLGERLADRRDLVTLVVRVGLGAAFVFLGVVQKLFNAGAALAVVEKYDLTAVVPVSPELWVVGAALAEVALGLALAAGLFTRFGAGVAIGVFTATLFALPDDPVLAHVSLFGLASLLVVTGGGPRSLDARLADRLDTDPGIALREREATSAVDAGA